jgi:hypothetical protein
MTIAYSQRDMEWSDDKLGTSPDLTVGQAGCLITSIASVLSDFTSRMIAPGELNQWLRENGGFTGGGLFVWDSITSLGLRRAETIQCVSQPAPVQHLADLLADGAAVVVEVDSIPDGPLNQHWVRLLSIDDKDGQIMDPWQWPGREFTTLSRYFAPGWTPQRAIFMAVAYRPAAATRDLFGDGGHQAALCIRADTEPPRTLSSATSRGLSKPRRRSKSKPGTP